MTSSRAFRWAVALVWPIALIVFLYERTAWLGFNVVDEGLIASYSDRLLHGQVPHRDFISPRPIGSSILHLPDLLIPMPQYLGGRLVGIASVVAYSVLIAWLIYGKPPTEWGVVRAAGAAASALINLHTFIETPWYTFDGLLLSAASMLMLERAVRRESMRLGVVAFLLAGLAVTTKQSFAPTVIGLLLWLLWATRDRPFRVRARLLAAGALLAALPMLLYVGVISAFGGFTDVVDQLTSGSFVWGRELLESVGIVGGPRYGRAPYHGHFPWEVAVAAVVVMLARRRGARPAVRVAIAVTYTLLVARLCFHQDLSRTGTWSLELMWAFVLTLAVRMALERRIDGRQLAVLLLAWMSMLSRGYGVPALMAGSIVLSTLAWVWGDLFPIEFLKLRSVAIACSALAVAAFGFTLVREVQAREAEPYFDRPKADLRYSVAEFSPEFKGIKTSVGVHNYMAGLQECRRRFPAYWTAVIPDNPGLYRTMHMHNPFPIDWFFAQDHVGQGGRLIEAARELDKKGDYLVLLQSVSGFFISEFGRVPPVADPSVGPAAFNSAPIYDPKVARGIVASLHGRRLLCGSFFAIWQPRAR